MKKFLIKINLIIVILSFAKINAENKVDANQDLLLAISQNNFDNTKLALALGASANFENPTSKKTMLFEALEKLRMSYKEKGKKWIYVYIGTMFTVLILDGALFYTKVLNNHHEDLILKLGLAGILSLGIILSSIKPYKMHKNYANSHNIVRELLLTIGTFIDKKIEEEFAESKQIPSEIASMIKAILIAQKTADKVSTLNL